MQTSFMNIKVNFILFPPPQKKLQDSSFNPKLCNKQLKREYCIKYLGIRTSSETQGLLVGTMQYFRASDIFGAKGYFKGWRAPDHFFLPNEFQRWSKSVPLIGQKCFSGRSTRRCLACNPVAFLHQVVFFFDRSSCLAFLVKNFRIKIWQRKP